MTWRASLEGLAIAGSVILLFALPPLLEIRQVKPFLLFRRDTELRRFDRVQFAARLLVPVGVLALAVWQAGSFPSARSFIATVGVTAVALNLAGSVLISVLSRVGRVRSLPVRYAIGNLCRRGTPQEALKRVLGDRRVSYSATRNSSDTIVAVRFWDATASSQA